MGSTFKVVSELKKKNVMSGTRQKHGEPSVKRESAMVPFWNMTKNVFYTKTGHTACTICRNCWAGLATKACSPGEGGGRLARLAGGWPRRRGKIRLRPERLVSGLPIRHDSYFLPSLPSKDITVPFWTLVFLHLFFIKIISFIPWCFTMCFI